MFTSQRRIEKISIVTRSLLVDKNFVSYLCSVVFRPSLEPTDVEERSEAS